MSSVRVSARCRKVTVAVQEVVAGGRTGSRGSLVVANEGIVPSPSLPALFISAPDQSKSPLQVAELISGSRHAPGLTSPTLCVSQFFNRAQVAAAAAAAAGTPPLLEHDPADPHFFPVSRHVAPWHEVNISVDSHGSAREQGPLCDSWPDLQCLYW